MLDGTHSVQLSASSVSAARRHGEFTAYAFRGLLDGCEHIALAAGRAARAEGCLVRVHSEGLLGDVFGSSRCASGGELDAALAAIAQEVGGGLSVVMRQTTEGAWLCRVLSRVLCCVSCPAFGLWRIGPWPLAPLALLPLCCPCGAPPGPALACAPPVPPAPHRAVACWCTCGGSRGGGWGWRRSWRRTPRPAATTARRGPAARRWVAGGAGYLQGPRGACAHSRRAWLGLLGMLCRPRAQAGSAVLDAACCMPS